MKTILCLLIILLAGCATFTTKPQTLQAAAYFGAYKVLDNSSAGAKPRRVQLLRDTAADLARVADGSVSSAEVADVLARHLGGDPDMQALSLLILAWFPAEAPVSAALSDLAHNAALGISAALPLSSK